ncbi:HEPN domain-containing protein [Maridesulfovibrio sp.]|uniref:HEPN domain-containing protein n=1 Tax=Maridesulfovibrio sp. TaxID=2795000 RepID=UPI0029C9D6B2|nr:HEPN domain-containing protein [Maridesulfovibrio sp.]
MNKIVELAQKIIRILNESPSFQDDNRFDWLCLIPSPSGKGDILIGRDGQQAFSDMVRIYWEKQKKKDPRYDLNDLVAPLKQKFSDRFLKEGLPVNEKYLSRVFSRVCTEHERSWKKSKYYMPCNLFISELMKPIEIGPVKFIPAEQFLENNLSNLEKEKNCSSVLDSFKRHNWVAIAAVEKCSPKVAEKIAYKAVEFAIATLQLVWGADQTDCFKIEESHQATARNWAIEVDGNFECGWSRNFGRSFPVEWSDSLLDDEIRQVISFSATVLNKYLSFELVDRLDNLILESILMYQNAIRESDYYIKIMKYVFAAEALLLPVDCKNEEIAGRFKERFAAVVSCDFDNFTEKKAFFSTAYNIRCDIAHGRFIWKTKEKQKINCSVIERDVAALIYNVVCFIDPCNTSVTNHNEELDEALIKRVSEVKQIKS